MWIDREEYEELVNDRNHYQILADQFEELCDEYSESIESRNNLVEVMDEEISNLKKQNEDLLQIIMHLEETLDHVIDITFTDNRNFETVVFQRYSHAPVIYYKGERIKSDLASKIQMTFVDGKCKMNKTDSF